jgi:hypothetical protein
MLLHVVLHAEMDIGDWWATKEDLDSIALNEDGTYNLEALAELFGEDWTSFLEPLIPALLKSAVWVDK